MPGEERRRPERLRPRRVALAVQVGRRRRGGLPVAAQGPDRIHRRRLRPPAPALRLQRVRRREHPSQARTVDGRPRRRQGRARAAVVKPTRRHQRLQGLRRRRDGRVPRPARRVGTVPQGRRADPRGALQVRGSPPADVCPHPEILLRT